MGSLHIVDMFVSGQMKGVHIKRNAENVALKKKRNLTKMRIHGNQRKGKKIFKNRGVSKKPKKELENENDVRMDSNDSDTDNKSDNQDIETPKKETASDNQDSEIPNKETESEMDSKDIDTENKSLNRDSENKDNEA